MTGGLIMFNYIDSTTALVFVVTFLAVWLYILTRRDVRIPPGPPLLPVIGNLLSAAKKDSLENLVLLGQKYGDIYGLYIGKELTVVLNSFDVINDALLKKGRLFSRRPVTPFTEAVDRYTGVIDTNDELWKEQRSFTQNALQQLCFKNKSQHIEKLILTEAGKLLAKLEGREGALNPKRYLFITSANVIGSIIWSKSYDLDDPKFSKFLDEMTESSRSVVKKLVLVNCFPFLLKLPFDILDMKMIFRGPLKWHKSLDERLENDDMPSNKYEDFLDLYLKAIEENEVNNRGQSYTIPQMKYTTFDLQIAGSETTATTVSWLLLHILHNPTLETKLHSEIDDVIGKDRSPSLMDRSKMPYIEATIMEALRFAPPAPLAFPHSVPHDVKFRDYLIPKNTTVLANIYAVHRDPKLWGDPSVFRPERFLSEDKKSVVTPKYFIPFSVGPRSCLGETLAKMELFLFLTSILQKFKLRPADDSKLPQIEGVLWATYNPQPYELRFVRR